MGLYVLLAVLSVANANHIFRVVNHCSYTVDVGMLNNPGKPLPRNGGFRLYAGQQQDVNIPDGWAGRMWGRTGCDNSGNCETGFCGYHLECQGAGGRPPATLAEWTLQGHAGLDYYDVSLVDGYNLKMRVTPMSGTYDYSGGGGAYYCQQAGCTDDINAHCPSASQVHGSGGRVVACKSGCETYHTSEKCCSGAHNRPQTCPPFAESQLFKRYCSKAYSYAYDDAASTFTCKGRPSTGYTIEFC